MAKPSVKLCVKSAAKFRKPDTFMLSELSSLDDPIMNEDKNRLINL